MVSDCKVAKVGPGITSKTIKIGNVKLGFQHVGFLVPQNEYWNVLHQLIRAIGLVGIHCQINFLSSTMDIAV